MPFSLVTNVSEYHAALLFRVYNQFYNMKKKAACPPKFVYKFYYNLMPPKETVFLAMKKKKTVTCLSTFNATCFGICGKQSSGNVKKNRFIHSFIYYAFC